MSLYGKAICNEILHVTTNFEIVITNRVVGGNIQNAGQ
jgi:hypothetical protein